MSAVSPWWCCGYGCEIYIEWCCSSCTYHLLFSSVFFLPLFTTLSYKTPIISYFEYLIDDNLNSLWGIHSSHNSQNNPTTSRWPVGGPFSPTDSLQCPWRDCSCSWLCSCLTTQFCRMIHCIYFPWSLNLIFNLLLFCFSEVKKRGSICVFSTYWRRRVGHLYLILCLSFNFKISRKF